MPFKRGRLVQFELNLFYEKSFVPNRTIIVSDSNVFVFLIRSNTFETVFHKTRFKIVVPGAVVDEIKNGLISRKYPAGAGGKVHKAPASN